MEKKRPHDDSPDDKPSKSQRLSGIKEPPTTIKIQRKLINKVKSTPVAQLKSSAAVDWSQHRLKLSTEFLLIFSQLESSKPFLDPPEVVPDCPNFAFLKQPLATILEKIQKYELTSTEAVASAIRRVFAYPMFFNPTDSQIYKQAEAVSSLFEHSFYRIFTEQIPVQQIIDSSAADLQIDSREEVNINEPLSEQSKKELYAALQNLDETQLISVCGILLEACPAYFNPTRFQDNEESEIDLTEFRNPTLQKLWLFSKTLDSKNQKLLDSNETKKKTLKRLPNSQPVNLNVVAMTNLNLDDMASLTNLPVIYPSATLSEVIQEATSPPKPPKKSSSENTLSISVNKRSTTPRPSPRSSPRTTPVNEPDWSRNPQEQNWILQREQQGWIEHKSSSHDQIRRKGHSQEQTSWGNNSQQQQQNWPPQQPPRVQVQEPNWGHPTSAYQTPTHSQNPSPRVGPTEPNWSYMNQGSGQQISSPRVAPQEPTWGYSTQPQVITSSHVVNDAQQPQGGWGYGNVPQPNQLSSPYHTPTHSQNPSPRVGPQEPNWGYQNQQVASPRVAPQEPNYGYSAGPPQQPQTSHQQQVPNPESNTQNWAFVGSQQPGSSPRVMMQQDPWSQQQGQKSVQEQQNWNPPQPVAQQQRTVSVDEVWGGMTSQNGATDTEMTWSSQMVSGMEWSSNGTPQNWSIS